MCIRDRSKKPPAAPANPEPKSSGSSSGVGRGALVGGVVFGGFLGYRIVSDEESSRKFDGFRQAPSAQSGWALVKATLGQDRKPAPKLEAPPVVKPEAPLVEPEPEPPAPEEPVVEEQTPVVEEEVAPVIEEEPVAPEPVVEEVAPVVEEPAPPKLETVMSEEEQAEAAAEIAKEQLLASVASLPAEDALEPLKDAAALQLDASLPADFEQMSFTQQIEACEAVIERVRQQYDSLISELDNRTQWEAVRLGTALRQKEEEQAARLEAGIRQAMELQGAKFDAALNHRQNALKQAHIVEMSARLGEQKQQLQAALQRKIAQLAAAAETQAAEEVQIARAQLMLEVGEAAKERTEQLHELQSKVQALEQVMLDDSAYKRRCHQAHQLSRAVLAISLCLEEARPFTSELAALQALAEHEPVIAAVVSSLPEEAAQRGASTRLQLRESLAEVSSEACRAALMPEDGGLLWFGFTWAINKAKIKEKGQVAGDTVDAMLTRVEDHLEQGNLHAAVAQCGALNGMAAQVMKEWQTKATERLMVEQALELARAHMLCLTGTFE
eukprot:TRINITY_DN14160_c0_g1_i1.p1 TRINITY_DN14160_c0_g1~~TRINITY_DN14160_c0_g1_i1.p1  ORF type:complete len:555 (-),score=212.19 TRINITY_DN14160_c0_g1_i1:74-1738(-)